MLSDTKKYILYGAAGVAAYLWLRKSSAKSHQPSTDFDSFLKAPAPSRAVKTTSATSFAAFLHVQPEEPCSTEFASFLKDRSSGAQQASTQKAADSTHSEQVPVDAVPVLVMYGTEYGFAREIAEKLCQQLKDTGKYWPSLVNAADCPEGYDLASQQAALMVFSTQGDGVPPSEARDFCEWLFANHCGTLPNLRYSVCALGDTTYTHFCRCGKQIDAAFTAAGAAQLTPRVDINREDWPAVDAWIAGVLSALSGLSGLKTLADLGLANSVGSANPNPNSHLNPKKYSKAKPYYARVVAVEGLCVLNGPDDKDTVRLELELQPDAVAAGGLTYLPGDALGIWPTNPPEVVDELLQQLGATGDECVPIPSWHYTEDPTFSSQAAAAADNTISLRHALSVCYDIKTPKAPQLLQIIVEQLAAAAAAATGKAGKQNSRVSIDLRADSSTVAAPAAAPANGLAAVQDSSSGMPDKQAALVCAAVGRIEQLLADNSALEAYLAARHVADILQDHPAADLTFQQLLPTLRPLQPRLYSISSSPLEHTPANGGVQATIAVVRYESLGKQRQGVCSTQVGERLEPGMYLPVFMSKNPDFRLPADPKTPIIMVGPGTGLAPFRSFILQRLLEQQQNGTQSGPMHLFFGCRRRDQDFLYGQQLQQWHDSGLITLHTAFSRETGKKVYVQQRLREAADTVWQLLEGGGHFYVCGDAANMAGAVEQALLDVIQQHQEAGTTESARQYVDGLAAAGRYERDVWFS